MRLRVLFLCFILIMFASIARAEESNFESLVQCLSENGVTNTRIVDTENQNQISFTLSFSLTNFPLGKFCGEFLPDSEKEKLRQSVYDDFTAVEKCLKKKEVPETIALQISGGGFSDAAEFFRELDAQYECQNPATNVVDLMKTYFNSNDHVKLGLLRMITAENLFLKDFVAYLGENTNGSSRLTKNNVIWKSTEYVAYEQDKREGTEFRRAEFRIDVIISYKKAPVTIIKSPEEEVKSPVESLPEPIFTPEEDSGCRFNCRGTFGLGVMMPILGLARNTFDFSGLSDFDLAISNTCLEDWTFSLATVLAIGYHEKPYEGDKNQIFTAFGAGFRGRHWSRLWGRDFGIGGDVRWMYLTRDIAEIGGQYTHALFVGPIFTLARLWEDFPMGIETRFGLLDLEVNFANSPNFYGEALLTIPLW